VLKLEVLEFVKEERSMLSTITRREKNWIGHRPILRGQSLLRDVMEGRMEGKRTRDKGKKESWDDR